LWVAPDQYSFPFGLENLGLLGYTQLFYGTFPKSIPRDPQAVPWHTDFEQAILGPLKFNGGRAPGAYEELVMLHKASGTLLVTDIVQSVDAKVPSVFDDDPDALLYHARENVNDKVVDSPAVRDKGWKRIALLALFFQPGGFNTVPISTALNQAKGSKMPELGWGGFYPFDYRSREAQHPPKRAYWQDSFDALVGKTFVPPLLQELVLDREPKEVLRFADQVAQWRFERIVPAHFASVIAAGPQEFRAAFGFLEADAEPRPETLDVVPLCGDNEFLRSSSKFLVKYGASGAPDQGVEAARKARRGLSCAD